MTPPPSRRPRGVSASAGAATASRRTSPSPTSRPSACVVYGGRHGLQRERIVQAQAEHEPFARLTSRSSSLHLPGRWCPRARAACRPRAWASFAAGRLDCRNRAEPDPEVVPSEPVAEVVPGAQVAAVRPLRLETEVRRLVPAVAGRRQRLDHLLEVRLHRFGLARELGPVRMREPGSRLRLELVAREVLRARARAPRSDRVRDRRRSRRGSRTGDREICCQNWHHGDGRRRAGQRPGRPGARAPRATAGGSSAHRARHAVTPPRRSRASSGVTVSGFASTVTSAAGGSPSRRRASSVGPGEGRRPAAEEHRLERGSENAAARARAPPAAHRRTSPCSAHAPPR